MNRPEHVVEGSTEPFELGGPTRQPIGLDAVEQLHAAAGMRKPFALLMKLVDISFHGLRRHGGLEQRIHAIGKH